MKRATAFCVVLCVLGGFAWLKAAPSNADVPVTQVASGQASGGGSVNIEQLVVVFSLRAESGSGAAGDQSQYAVHQSAQAVVTDGASVTIRQDVVDATIAEALTSGSGSAVGVADRDNVDQDVNVHASGPISVSVNQIAGLLDVGAAAAGNNGSAVGATGSQQITQVIVWQGTNDAQLGQRATISNVGHATDGSVSWDDQEDLTADEARALIDQARAATTAILATQGIDADVQPDWISSLQIDRKDVVQQPSDGVTVRQSVAVVVVQLTTQAVERIRQDNQTPAGSLVDALPVATPNSSPDNGTDGSGPAVVVGSRAEDRVCQEIGAPERCAPVVVTPPAGDPGSAARGGDPSSTPTDPASGRPSSATGSDASTTPEAQGAMQPAAPVAVDALLIDPAAAATNGAPTLAASPNSGPEVGAANSRAALARSGVDAESELLLGTALMMMGLALTGAARHRLRLARPPRHLAGSRGSLSAGRHYARPPARHAHAARDRR